MKVINKLDLNLEEVEVYYYNNNFDFYRFTSSNKIVFIIILDIIFIVVLYLNKTPREIELNYYFKIVK